MNKKQIAVVCVLAASALAVSTVFLLHDIDNGKSNTYKAIVDDIFRDYDSKSILRHDIWACQYAEKMVSVAKGMSSEQEKMFFIEECVKRILNVRFQADNSFQAENLSTITWTVDNFQAGLLYFCWALQALDVDSDIIFDIIIRWTEKARAEYMAILDMPYDTGNYRAWRDKLNAVGGVKHSLLPHVFSVRENLFHRYLPNVKGQDRVKYQKRMDEYCEEIKADVKVIENYLEQFRRKSPNVKLLKFNSEENKDKK